MRNLKLLEKEFKFNKKILYYNIEKVKFYQKIAFLAHDMK